MAMDCIRRIYDHIVLLKITQDKKPNIDLFIHSNGGDGTVPWRLVTLLREFSDQFSVMVPYSAFSAATLTALGADSIVMHPMGMLGPTDPTVKNEFNPKDPSNPSRTLGISVEDVTAYIALIKDDAGIQHEDEMVVAFNKLAEQVHPLALGNVKRSLSQSRMMARKLLSLHMDARHEGQRINDVVDNLTSKLFYHGHPINRTEAKEQVGISTVEFPEAEVEGLMWKLYLEYEREIKMESPFDYAEEFRREYPSQALSGTVFEVTKPMVANLAYVESLQRTDVLRAKYEVSGKKLETGLTDCNLIVLSQGWEVE